MLAKIIMKNFKSFKNETVIDFTRINYKFLENNVSNNGVLKGVAFYGANASGKSNVLWAIRFLLDELFGEEKNPVTFMKCLFSDEPEFSLQYFFVIESREIHYLIDFHTEKGIINEELYLDRKLLLQRMGSTAKSGITEKKVYTDLNNKVLFLRTVYFNTGFSGDDKDNNANNNILRQWFDYMQNSIYVNPFLHRGIAYGKQDVVLNKYLENEGVKEINRFFTKYNFEYTLDYLNERKVKDVTEIVNDDNIKLVFFNRKGVNVPIPYVLESHGNQNLLNILPCFLRVVQNSGMLLVDEFSGGLHNELERCL